MKLRPCSFDAAARVLAVAVAAPLLLPAAASAHGLVGRQDLPIPRWLFAWAAALVLVASFVGLAALWSRPQLQDRAERKLFAVPLLAEILAGAAGIALFVLVVYAGLAGAQVDTTNIAPTMIFVAFWVGIPVASVLFGDFARALLPWRAIGRATGWVVHRAGGGEVAAPMPYPERLGRWPAVAGIIAFTWVELVYPDRSDPSHLAVLALAYCAVQLVGMSLFGERAWTRNGDAFAALFDLCGRISPFSWHDRALHLRRPLAGLPALPTPPGTVALLCALIGTTSFDGFSMGPIWLSWAPKIQNAFTGLGLGKQLALVATGTLGMAVMLALTNALYRIGIDGVRTAARSGPGGRELARTFAHTLAPIAAAYLLAHYFSLLAYQGQALSYLASDPLGHGSDLFGTAGGAIDYTWIGANGVWYVQTGALIVGHVAGLILAHDRALALYPSAKDATRSQYWMLAVMVTFTSLGLWLLSSSGQ